MPKWVVGALLLTGVFFGTGVLWALGFAQQRQISEPLGNGKTPVSVVGRVLLGDTPLAGGRIRMQQRGESDEVAAELDAEGRFELSLPTHGEYWLNLVDATGASAWFACASGRPRPRLNHAMWIQIPPGATHALEIAVPVGSLSGRLIDEHGTPLSAMDVRAFTNGRVQGTSSILRATTDAQGRFTMAPMPTGTYSVTAGAADDIDGYHSSRFYTHVHVPDVVISDGVERRGIELMVRAAGRVEGVIRDADGERVAGASVFHLRADGWMRGDVTDSLGRFSMNGVQTGQVWIFATGNHATSSPRLIKVRARRRIGVEDLVLEPNVWITVRTVDAQGKPVRSQVSVTDTERGIPVYGQPFASNEGAAYFELPPGTYQMAAADASSEAHATPRTIRVEGPNSVETTLELTE